MPEPNQSRPGVYGNQTPAGMGVRTMANALWNLAPLVWSSVLGLVTIPIVVKSIGMEHFGLYGLFAVLLAPLSLANLGFAEATIKYVAEYAAAKDYDNCARFVQTTLFFNLMVGGICGALVAAVGPLLGAKFFNISAADTRLFGRCLGLVGITWAVNQAGSVYMGIPPAMYKFKLVATCQIIITTATSAASIAAVLSGYGLYGYTAATLAGSLIGLGVWGMAGSSLLPGRSLLPRLDLAVWKRAFHFGSWRAAAQAGGLLASQAERFLLGVYLSPQSVGFYNVGINLEQRAYIVVSKMSEVLFPMFSAVESESMERKFSLLMRATWLLTSLAVSALAPMVALAKPLLAAWIDQESAEKAGLLLQVLSIGGILGCATNAANFFLLGTGKTKWGALLSLATGLSTVLGALLILPRYGLRGAAFAGALAMLVQQAVLGGYMLPRIFGRAFEPMKCFVAFYAPVSIGLAISILASQIRFPAGLSLIPVLLAYALLSGLCGCLILVCHLKLPHGITHVEDAARVLRFVRGRFAAGRV